MSGFADRPAPEDSLVSTHYAATGIAKPCTAACEWREVQLGDGYTVEEVRWVDEFTQVLVKVKHTVVQMAAASYVLCGVEKRGSYCER